MKYCVSYRRFPVTLGSIVFIIARFAHGEASYSFDDNLLLGSGLAGGKIERFNRVNQIDPGSYMVDLYLNNDFVSRSQVVFRSFGDLVEPCFSESFFRQSLSARGTREQGSAATVDCIGLSDRLPGASFKLDTARLRLELTAPQVLLDIKPRGYISPQEWDPGNSMAFLNYDANVYRSSYKASGGGNSNFGYLGLRSGANIGLWRFRHQSSYSYSASKGSSPGQWNSIRTYVQRAVPEWGSELTIGQTYTEGNLFGSVGYRGARLATDDRMLPDSQRHYAPQVRGTANSNARIIISQVGRKIHEVSVPPGPFMIDDLYGTAYNGDLDVQVVEAEGSVSRFTVPYAAVPDSIRPGLSRYSATFGELMLNGSGKEKFLELTYQRGLTNALSANLGSRVAQDYVALLGGGVLGTPFGAFGVNSIFSSATIENNQRTKGWRLGLNYSRTFQPTNTTLTLAGYRYSTEGYRDLSDAVGARNASVRSESWDSSSFKQRNQLTLMVNQALGSYGSVYLSGSKSDYYDGKSRDIQAQFGYSNSWGRLSYNLAYSRQRTTWYRNNTDSRDLGLPEDGNLLHGRSQNNSLTFSVSMPLGGSKNSSSLSSMVARRSGDTKGSSFQTGLSGTFGEGRTLSYALAAGRDSDRRGMDWSGTLQNQTSVGTFNGGYSESSNYQQFNGGMRGAAVLHGGGVTLGPYVGDTFALVQAKGASGSAIRGGQGARVDRNGYAVMPSLSPYRYNSVGLDPRGIGEDAELLETERKVAPYSGAAVLVTFKTLTGHALLIRAKLVDGSSLPLGADVVNEHGVNLGMVGQGGNVYARASDERGQLRVKWGDRPEDSCQLPYDLSKSPAGANQALIHLVGVCMTNQERQ